MNEVVNEASLDTLRQELIAIDEHIEALNAQIKDMRWRHTPEGDRRGSYRAATADGYGRGLSICAMEHADGSVTSNACLEWTTLEQERRLPMPERVSHVRHELSVALQRYMMLQSLLRDQGAL